MIISGYVYSLSLNKENPSCSLDIITSEYLIKKIFRLTIPFTILFVLEWAVLLIFSDNYAFNLMTLKTIGVYFLTGGTGPGSYYYPVMMQFVFVAPLIFCVIKKYEEKGVVLSFVANLFYEVLQRAYGMNEQCYRLLLFRYTFLIAFGCYLALNRNKFKKRWYFIAFLAGIAFQILTQYTQYNARIIIYWTRTSCISALYIIPIFFIMIKLVKPEFCVKPINAIGRASYNVFLVQMVYYFHFAKHIYKIVESRPIQIIINIIICSLVGFIFYKIETPITKALTSKCLSKVKRNSCSII